VNAVPGALQSLPEQLQRSVACSPVVLVVSPLTDARPVSGWLERHGIAFEQVELSMASAQSRAEFHQLQAATGWHGLPQIFFDGEFVGGIEEFFAHPRVARAEPPAAPQQVRRAAQWLGYLGGLPFVACAVFALLAEVQVRALALQALLAYGAVILSFVGALHWTRGLQAGAAATGTRLLLVSVLPALLGWVALLLPWPEGGVLLAIGFAVMYLFDRRAWRAQPWFQRLRLHLSATAILCLVSGAAFAAVSP
jgi:glutaredoxin